MKLVHWVLIGFAVIAGLALVLTRVSRHYVQAVEVENASKMAITVHLDKGTGSSSDTVIQPGATETVGVFLRTNERGALRFSDSERGFLVASNGGWDESIHVVHTGPDQNKIPLLPLD